MLQLVLPSSTRHTHREPWGLYDTEHSRHIEAQAQASLPPGTLMQRAGQALSQLALALAPHASIIWIACGPGNNGGDGLAAALELKRAGKHVHVTLAASPERLPADALAAWQRARDAGLAIHKDSSPPPLTPHDLAIDALLGLGGQREPQGALAELIHTLNALPCPVLAVDLPTGLRADTGQCVSDIAVRAQHTLALLTLKPGLFTAQGRDHAGTVWLDTLGVNDPASPPQAQLTQAAELTPRQHAQHKGSFGDLIVLGGAPGMVGAAMLAGRAALTAGAGRVYVDLLDPHAPRFDAARPELMLRAADATLAAPQRLQHSTMVAGCGGGEPIGAHLPRLISHAARLVLDADALNVIAADASLQTLLIARGAASIRSGAPLRTILTPHPLEAARLLAVDTASVQSDRLAAAQRLADRFGAVVVLKGSGTVIAAPGALPHINSTGNAALASGGTGDVLAGHIGGSWSAHQATLGAMAVTLRSVYLHGLAADQATVDPLRAADLIDAMQARADRRSLRAK